MNPTVQAALIGSITSIIICLIGYWQQNKKREQENAIRDALLDQKLASIERKLDSHNQYGDKIGSIEQNLAYIRGKLEGG